MALAIAVRRVVMFLFAACSGISRAGEHDTSNLTRTLPDIPAPPQGDAWWISKSMRMNGLPMTLKNFRSRLNLDEVCDFYRSSARALTSNQIIRRRTGDWSVMSIRTRRNLITIQVRSTLLGSEGTIAVSPPPESIQLRLSTAFPRSATASIVNLQEYDDTGMEAEHISLTSARPIAFEAHAFIQKLTRAGWTITLREPAKIVAGGQIIEAQQGVQHALLSFMPDKGRPGNTSIVVVWKKS